MEELDRKIEIVHKFVATVDNRWADTYWRSVRNALMRRRKALVQQERWKC